MLDHSVQRHPLAERGHDLCETPAEIPSDQLGAVAMTGGRASRQKGNRAERAIVRLLRDRRLAAERVPLSGAVRGRFGGDISVPALGCDLRGEAKCRGNGFSRLYDWLGDRDFLVIRADRKPLLVIASIELATEIVMAAKRGKGARHEDH